MRFLVQNSVLLILGSSLFLTVATTVAILIAPTTIVAVGYVIAILLALAGFTIVLRRQARGQAQATRMLRQNATRIAELSRDLRALREAIGILASREIALTVPVIEGMDALRESIRQLAAEVDGLPRAPEWTAKQWDAAAERIFRGKKAIDESTRRLVAKDAIALITLNNLVEMRSEPPATTGFTASPETLLGLVALVDTLDDGAVILEAGSGLSTVWLALAIEKSGKRITLIALEHDELYARATRDALARQRTTAAVEVRYAPLEVVEGQGEDAVVWFARESWSAINRVDVMFVDGPPQSTGDHPRRPAFPLLRRALVDGAVVILDDTDRRAERETLDAWTAPGADGTLSVERELDRSTVLRFSAAG